MSEGKVTTVRAAWENPRNDFVVWSVASQLTTTKKWSEVQILRFIIKATAVVFVISLAVREWI